MNYRTLWSYLRFEEQVNNHVIIPQIVLEACLGMGEGSKLLTEIEGEILELLISGEQGAVKVNSFNDLKKCLSPANTDTIEDQFDSGYLLTPDALMEALKSIHNKGYVKFEGTFFF